LISSVSFSEKLFIAGDLNGHIGSTRVGFDEVHVISDMGVGIKNGRVS
jgi:hypothetical protein